MTRVTLLALVLPACPRKDRQPPAPPVQSSSLPEISVKPRPQLLLTYLADGRFETAEAIDKVPEQARGWVRVVDLAVRPEKRRDHELVYVADLRRTRDDGSYPYIVMSRGAFELAARTRASAGATDPPPSAASGDAGGKQADAKVVLYATAWCPACKAARRFLEDKKIPYREKDIEKDPAAAAELMRKARAAGISASGVPVLDVDGTLMQGFDPARLMHLLGEKR